MKLDRTYPLRVNVVRVLTMTSAATMCISSNVRTIEVGAPGIVNGVANESTNATTATMRKTRTGRRVNQPMSA